MGDYRISVVDYGTPSDITMDPVGQPVLTGQGIVYVCAVVFNLLLLYMSIFGESCRDIEDYGINRLQVRE